MKSKLKNRRQEPPAGPSYSLFLSPQERLVLDRALVYGLSADANAKREGKENVIRWAEQVRCRAAFLQLVLDGVLKIQVTGQAENDFQFLADESKEIQRGKRETIRR